MICYLLSSVNLLPVSLLFLIFPQMLLGIIEWFKYKGRLEVQSPHNEQEHQLDQLAHSPVQNDPGHFQRWGMDHLSG